MNADFVKLVETEHKKIQNGATCFYIGEGNPDADILIIGNECAIGDDDPRLSKLSNECSEDDRRKIKERIIAKDNVEGWKKLFDQGYDAEGIRRELHDYKGETGSDKYYPLFPNFGQKCLVRTEVNKDKGGEKGTARTWVQYQKLIDWIYGKVFDRNNFIDFHLNAFHTELSQIPRKRSGKYNKETDDSIQKRMKELFCNPFFQKFPVVIIAAGHYVRDYEIDIIGTFDVVYKGDIGKSGWINLHESSDSRRLLLHTKHFAAAISNDYIKEIAEFASPYIERPNKR